VPAHDEAELNALIDEYKALDPTVVTQRSRAILLRAAELVDRTISPRKWAGLRQEYARCSEQEHQDAAIAAYREALAVWDSDNEQDRTVRAYCCAGLGNLLAKFPPGSPEGEEALQHLALGLEVEPWGAGLLGVLYGLRPVGDPAENWQKQIKYLEQARQQISAKDEPHRWAKLTNELACAFGAEPVTDYTAPVEKQIELHRAALAVLHEGDQAWAETCLHLGTAYLNRPNGQAGR
jgi:tetratricopeptide (TPR) repeat protein